MKKEQKIRLMKIFSISAVILSVTALIIAFIRSGSLATYGKDEAFIITSTILIFAATILVESIVKVREYIDEKQKFAYREYLVNRLDYKIDDEKIIFATRKRPNKYTSKNEQKNSSFQDDDKDGKKDIIALMLKNNDEITEYFKISKSQAKSSYRLSIISCIAGVVILGIAIYGATVMNNTKLAIIATVSGAIVEVISGTVLWVHNKSALQLNHYYDALHENEKFLSAINIADKLSEENKEKMYKSKK